MVSVKNKSGTPRLVMGSEINSMPHEAEWLWEPYVPLRHYTVLSADTGVGKSRLALHLIKELYEGKLNLPAGTNALFVDLEGMHRKLASFYKKWGGDDSHLYMYGEFDGGFPVPAVKNMSDIQATAMECNARLIIMDSWGHLVGEKNANDMGVVLPITEQLKMMARALNAAVIVLAHNRKDGVSISATDDKTSPYAVRGSGAFVEQCRCAIALIPNDIKGFRLHHTKSNLSELAPPIDFYTSEEGEPIATDSATTVPAQKKLEADLAEFKKVALNLANAGASEREIRNAIKSLPNVATNAPTRAIEWLVKKKQFILE
jgi:hypothetical protein